MTGCDGVGTKLELLLEHDLLETAGKDLVAMSVNDILTTGGDPLLFLDYIGIAALHEEKITRLISGMADYLEACDCILAGGETAEMPGIVPVGRDRAFRFLHRLRGKTRPDRSDHRRRRRRADRLRLRQHPRQRLVARAPRAQRVSRRSHRRRTRRLAEADPPLSRRDPRFEKIRREAQGHVPHHRRRPAGKSGAPVPRHGCRSGNPALGSSRNRQTSLPRGCARTASTPSTWASAGWRSSPRPMSKPRSRPGRAALCSAGWFPKRASGFALSASDAKIPPKHERFPHTRMRDRRGPAPQAAGLLLRSLRHLPVGTEQAVPADGKAAQPRPGRHRHRLREAQHADRPALRPPPPRHRKGRAGRDFPQGNQGLLQNVPQGRDGPQGSGEREKALRFRRRNPHRPPALRHLRRVRRRLAAIPICAAATGRPARSW